MMGRPRSKRFRHLPRGVRAKHGAYFFEDYVGRWHKLCREDEGEARMYEALAKLKRAERDPDRMPVAIEQFKLEHLPTLAYSTRVEHTRIYDLLSAEFAEFTVAEVRPTDIARSLKNNWPTQLRMRKHAKSRLSTFFSWAVESGLRDDNPCRDLRLKDPPRHQMKWTDRSFHAIRDRLSGMLQCYLDLSFLLHQRTTDVRTIRWSQMRDGVIHFKPTKTAKSSGAAVDIPITPEIAAVLDRARSLAKIKPLPGGDAPVIQQSTGAPYTRFGIRSAFDRAAEAAGLTTRPDGAARAPASGLTAKDLRPYATTVAKRQGYTLEQLKVALAHTSITTTEGYVQQHSTPVSEVRLQLPNRPNSGQ